MSNIHANTLLIKAANSGDLSALKEALKKGADIHCLDNHTLIKEDNRVIRDRTGTSIGYSNSNRYYVRQLVIEVTYLGGEDPRYEYLPSEEMWEAHDGHLAVFKYLKSVRSGMIIA